MSPGETRVKVWGAVKGTLVGFTEAMWEEGRPVKAHVTPSLPTVKRTAVGTEEEVEEVEEAGCAPVVEDAPAWAMAAAALNTAK